MSSLPKSKRCPDCGEDRPVAEFSPNKKNSDGLGTYCRKHQQMRREIYLRGEQPLSRWSRSQAVPREWESSNGHFFLSVDELATYRESLDGRRSRVPNGFWSDDDGYQRGLACLRYAIEEQRHAHARTEVLAHATDRTLQELRLTGWQYKHALSIYDAFTAAWPDHDFMPWEMPLMVPRAYWEKHGDAAIHAALQWWLEREGLTPQELLRLLDRRDAAIIQRLDAAGLRELHKDRSVADVLRSMEPTLPPPPIMSKRARRRRGATLVCPWCGAPTKSLPTHRAMKHPDRSMADLRLVLGPTDHLETPSLQHRRRVIAQRIRSTDTAYWVRDGLTIPGQWWPKKAEYVRIGLGTGIATLIPAYHPAQDTWRMRRMGTRRILRIPTSISDLLRDEVTVNYHYQQIEITFYFKETFMPFRIWSKGQRMMSDLAILPSRGALMVREDVWPVGATHAAVAFDSETGKLGIIPVAAKGTIVGTTKPPHMMGDTYCDFACQ